MTFFLKLSILCIVFNSGLAYSASSSWIFKKKYDDVSIYTHKNLVKSESTRLMIRFQKSKIDLSKINKSFIKKIHKEQVKMLDFMKVTDWTVKNIKIKSKKGMTRVMVSGFYKDPKQNKVYFKEYQFYSSKKYLQILLTNNTKKQLKKQATLNTIKEFRKTYKL